MNEYIEKTDRLLLSHSTKKWQKVAMVIIKTIENQEYKDVDEQILFCTQRIVKLVENGDLLSRGNVENIRFSEIKLNK